MKQGLDDIKSEYVIFLNLEDMILFENLNHAYNYAKKYNFDILICGFEQFDIDNKKSLYNHLSSINELNDNLNYKKVFQLPKFNSNIYKTQFIRNMNITIPKIGEDSLFYIKSMFLTDNLGFYKKNIYYQIIHTHDNHFGIKYKFQELRGMEINEYYIYLNGVKDMISFFEENNLLLYFKTELFNYIFCFYRLIYQKLSITITRYVEVDFNKTDYDTEFQNSYISFKLLLESIMNIKKKYHAICILNLTKDNLSFYRKIISKYE